MRRWFRLVLLGLAVSAAACGNGVVIVSLNSGTIVGAPVCQGPGGQFQLRNPGGLLVLVVITSTTHIVVAGSGSGTCSDLFAGSSVQVSGRERGDRIVASSITVD